MLKQEKFDINSSNEELKSTFGEWLKESLSYHDELLKKQNAALDYYLGNQTDRDLVPTYLTNTVENRVFEAVETLVPIATANAHQFLVLPGSENEISVQKAEKLMKVLRRKYDTLEMQKKLEEITRDLCIKRVGVAKIVWDEISDDVDVRVIDPRLILIPKLRLDPHLLPYKIEVQDYTWNEILEYFPKINPEELSKEKAVDIKTGKETMKDTFTIYEVWTSEMVVWLQKGLVLEKKPNPYWDFEGDDTLEGKVYYNHLDRSQDPYIFFTTFNVKTEPLGSLALVEVGMPIQDSINVQKRQIIDNLRRMGNGQVYIDSEAMSEEESQNITNEIGAIIYGSGVASENRIRREQGMPLPEAHFANLQHSEMVFDNVMGVHSATRGAAASKTLGQDILSRQQDFTRIDLITRVLNRGMARIANYLVQVMKLFYDRQHVIKILGEEGAVEFIKFSRDDIEDHIEVEVKSGQTLPQDKISLRTEAIQLWQLGGLDPVTLFERLEFPNPEKAAERLVAWKMGQLDMETTNKIKEMQASSALKNEIPATSGQTSMEAGRGVETPLNVMQRAEAGLGGAAPVAALPNLPS